MWTRQIQGNAVFSIHHVIFILLDRVFICFILVLLLCSSGLTCPAADFVEESFLLAAKNSLSEEGLFVINLVTRSSTVKDAVYSSLKKVKVGSYKKMISKIISYLRRR